MNNNQGQTGFVERLKDCFDNMVVFKDLKSSNVISTFKLPSFMRDYVLKHFQDEDGTVDVDRAVEFISSNIPRPGDWKGIQARIIHELESVRILSKISINPNIAKGQISFSLPDFGLDAKDTIIPQDVWECCKTDLLQEEENWGIIRLSYQQPCPPHKGKIRLDEYKNFCPYTVDMDEFREAREQFTLEEWVDVILGAVDYNPLGYRDISEKLAVLKRLLPFAEKRINLLELAPPGTGKSYLFGQVSRYGWLVSGKAQRAALVYNARLQKDGIVSNHDFVALDEIREADYMNDAEIQSSLQAIMENGKYRAADGHEVNADAGIIFLGNIQSDKMNEYGRMLTELPGPFHQAQFLDRIHGFIKGWDLPRINNEMLPCGWALNAEYFSTVLHELREDPRYRAVVDNLVEIPPHSDQRDITAVFRMCTAYLKLLFPHAVDASLISRQEFKTYCLEPAMEMRSIIRIQMGIEDPSLCGKNIPEFKVAHA